MCWEKVKSLEADFEIIPEFDTIVSLAEDRENKTKGTRKAKLDIGVNHQVRIIELSRTQTPNKLVEFYNSKYAPGITDRNRDLIKNWYEGKIAVPTEKQAKVLMDVLNKAIEKGFTGIK
jgi:hypothetical protein